MSTLEQAPMIKRVVDFGWEKLKSLISVLKDLVQTLGVALTIGISAYQYNHGLAEESRMEFKRNLYQRKLVAYERVGQSVASLLTAVNQDEKYFNEENALAFDSCERVFRRLYWGVLPLVEDTTVEEAMIRFGDQVRYYRDGEDPYDSLVVRSVALMDTCKRSLERYWARKSQFEMERDGE